MNFLHMTIGVHFCSLSVIGFPLSRCQYTVTLACGCDCFFSVYAKLRSILMMIGQSNDLFMVFASRRLSFFSDIIKWWTNSTLRSFYRLSQSPISALYTVLLVVSSKRWRRLRNAIKFKCIETKVSVWKSIESSIKPRSIYETYLFSTKYIYWLVEFESKFNTFHSTRIYKENRYGSNKRIYWGAAQRVQFRSSENDSLRTVNIHFYSWRFFSRYFLFLWAVGDLMLMKLDLVPFINRQFVDEERDTPPQKTRDANDPKLKLFVVVSPSSHFH